MNLAELTRYSALDTLATELTAEARTVTGAERDELLRDAIAARARMLEIARGDA